MNRCVLARPNIKQLYRVVDAMVILSISRTVIYEQIRSGRLAVGNAGAVSPVGPRFGDRGLHSIS